MNKKLSKTGCAAFALSVIMLIVCLCGCGEKSDVKKLGKGENMFYIVFDKGDGVISTYEIWTDGVYVGEALVENKLITFAKTSKGETYVSTADGKTVDFDKTNEYWTVYSGGKYLSSNPNDIGIACNETYVMRIDRLFLPTGADKSESESDTETGSGSSDTSSDGDSTDGSSDTSFAESSAAQSSSQS